MCSCSGSCNCNSTTIPRGPQGLPGPKGDKGDKGDQGLQGIAGKTILNGNTNPTSGQGVIGDFFINTNTDEIFGPKTISGWGSGTSLIGPQGPQGPSTYTRLNYEPGITFTNNSNPSVVYSLNIPSTSLPQQDGSSLVFTFLAKLNIISVSPISALNVLFDTYSMFTTSNIPLPLSREWSKVICEIIRVDNAQFEIRSSIFNIYDTVTTTKPLVSYNAINTSDTNYWNTSKTFSISFSNNSGSNSFAVASITVDKWIIN